MTSESDETYYEVNSVKNILLLLYALDEDFKKYFAGQPALFCLRFIFFFFQIFSNNRYSNNQENTQKAKNSFA